LRKPKPVADIVADNKQYNFNDPESKIMKLSNEIWSQSDNAQAAVCSRKQIIIAAEKVKYNARPEKAARGRMPNGLIVKQKIARRLRTKKAPAHLFQAQVNCGAGYWPDQASQTIRFRQDFTLQNRPTSILYISRAARHLLCQAWNLVAYTTVNGMTLGGMRLSKKGRA
jgi:hypothetical protein